MGHASIVHVCVCLALSWHLFIIEAHMRSGMSKIDRVRRGEMDTGYIHLPSIYTHGEKEKDGGAMSEGDTEKMEMAQKRD